MNEIEYEGIGGTCARINFFILGLYVQFEGKFPTK